ncbi:cutinase [Cadophora sp. MPI-SDFR-AT-0126]|nr:cutinase [Leotiomycetes sp. MPI-SDFR-AT-0126]
MKSLVHFTAIVFFAALAIHGLPTDNTALVSRQTNPLNPFLSIITNLPPVNILVDGAAGGLTNLEGLLVPVVGGTNQTDLKDGKPCAQMTIIFARGTTEPGNMGVFAGPQLVQAVKNAMPGTSINAQGVEYTATIQGYLAGGGLDGTTSMSNFVNQALETCPQTKIVMGGYSQGGQVVHNTAKSLSADAMAKVSSVVIFGDPQSQTPVTGAESKTLVICHSDDNICSNGDLILPAHLTYGFDSPQAGQFVAKMANGNGTTMGRK